MAQDVIVKKDGSTIVSKVLEITSTEVKYKKYNNLNGPTYSLIKTDIQVINYENGTKEMFDSVQTPTSQQSSTTFSPTVGTMITGEQGMSDSDLLRLVDKPKDLKAKCKKIRIAGWTIGGTLVAGGIILICLVIPTTTNPMGWKSNDILDKDEGLGAGLPLIGIGIATTTACLIRAHNIEKKAKEQVYSTPIFQHDFTFTNGTTLSTGMDMLNDNRLHTQTLGLGLRYNF